MRCLKLKDSPKENTESEQRGAGGAAGGVCSVLSRKTEPQRVKDRESDWEDRNGRYRFGIHVLH